MSVDSVLFTSVLQNKTKKHHAELPIAFTNRNCCYNYPKNKDKTKYILSFISHSITRNMIDNNVPDIVTGYAHALLKLYPWPLKNQLSNIMLHHFQKLKCFGRSPQECHSRQQPLRMS